MRVTSLNDDIILIFETIIPLNLHISNQYYFSLYTHLTFQKRKCKETTNTDMQRCIMLHKSINQNCNKSPPPNKSSA